MNIIKNIKKILEKHPHVKYQETNYSISIEPLNNNGFIVGVDISTEKYVVFFDGGHEGYSTEEEAMKVINLCLSELCRLKVTYSYFVRSSFRWVLQERVAGKWQTIHVSGISIFSFLYQAFRTEIKQNKILKTHG